MKRTILKKYIWGIPMGVILLAACSSEKMIQVNPQSLKLTPDSSGQVDLKVTLDVPARYLSRRSRLIILPQLMKGDRMEEMYDPLVLDAAVYSKKKERKQKLERWQDPYEAYIQKVSRSQKGFTLPYAQKMQLDAKREHNGKQLWGIVTTDGCGECTAMDTLLLATISDPSELITREAMHLEWMEPQFVVRPKVREGKGEARLQFVINRYDIRMDMGDNRQEMDRMLHTLQPIVEDSLSELQAIHISGLASADGKLSFNTPLAKNRAQSAKRWLLEKLPALASRQMKFTVSSKPEGWGPVWQAMHLAGDKDSVAVKEILTRYADENDDVQEKFIRRLPCWNKIKRNYLQKDRKVEYVYTYSIRSFTTDQELLQMYESRPDAFNEDEFLRVSTLKKDPSEKMEVYRTVLHYFPQSQVAANNLAILLLRENKPQEAEHVLQSLDSLSDDALNTLAATYTYQHDYERAIELLQSKREKTVEAAYNLGVIRALQRRFQEAYDLLLPYADINAAILALTLNKNMEADHLMNRMSQQTPLHEYVRALIAARMSDPVRLFRHLDVAVHDKSLRNRALVEYDFIPYRDEENWKKILEK